MIHTTQMIVGTAADASNFAAPLCNDFKRELYLSLHYFKIPKTRLRHNGAIFSFDK